MKKLTMKELKKLISYDPETGYVKKFKKDIRNESKDNDVSLHIKEYLIICIKNKKYYLPRIIFLYMTGRWPKNEIDHINGVRNDNRWVNLREATRQQNQHNKDKNGIHFCNREKKFISKIKLNSKSIYIGSFFDKKEAEKEYIKAKIKYHGDVFSSRKLLQGQLK